MLLSNTRGSTNLIPPPGAPATGLEYWDFDKSDTVSWKYDMYLNGSVLTSQMLYYNVSDILYDYNPNKFAWFYWVQLHEMYFNTSLNTIVEYENLTLNPLLNASLNNWTFGQMYTNDGLGFFDANYFIPNNGSTGLHMAWCAQALLNSQYGFLLGGSPTFTLTGNDIYMYDASFTVPNFVDLRYFNNGTLRTGHIYYDMGAMGYIEYNWTRNFDFNPLDEVEWPVGIGDVIYYGNELNETRYEISKISNETDILGPMQNVYANLSQWNFTTETWTSLDNDSLIAGANEQMFMMGMIIPKGAKVSDLVPMYSSVYDTCYGDDDSLWMSDTSLQISMEYHYFPSRIMKSMSQLNTTTGDEMVLYHKNVTVLSSGSYNENLTLLDYEDFFNISAKISVTGDTQFFSVGFGKNPSNAILPFGILYFDLMVNETAKVNFPVNVSIEYNTTYMGDYRLYVYNETMMNWNTIQLDDDEAGTLNATLQHFSIYGLTLLMGDAPGPLTASSPDAGSPDGDGMFTISWTSSQGATSYDLYKYSSPITEINGSLEVIDTGMINNSRIVTDILSGTWYFAAVAVNATGTTLSNNVVVTVQLPGPPPGPFSLSTTWADNPDKDGNFAINWTISSGATSYTLYRHPTYISQINGTVSVVQAGITQESFLYTNEMTGAYYYAVDAINASGTTFSSNNVYVNVVRDPPSPFSLSTTWADNPDKDGNFAINWTISSGATSYTLYRHPTYISQINGTVSVVHAGITQESFLYTNEMTGAYYYAVEAINATGTTFSSNNVYVNVVRDPPGPFTLTSTANNPDDDGSFDLTWTVSAGADNYSVYRHSSLITEINGSITTLAYETGSSPFSVSGLLSGDYYFIIVSKNETGSRMSNNIKETVLLPPGPVELSSNAGNPDVDGIFTLTWNTSVDAENYTLYSHPTVITQINGSLTVIKKGLTNNSYEIGPLLDGTEIYYVIAAVNLVANTSSNFLFVNVSYGPPGTFSLSDDATNPDGDGKFTLSWNTADGADNYSVYWSLKKITGIPFNSSVNLLEGNITALLKAIIKSENVTIYYIVVAFNNYGNSTSNCVSITILIVPSSSSTTTTTTTIPPDLEIPFGDFYLVFMVFGIIALVINKKKRIK